MAVLPLFVFGPNTALSLIGHLRGPKAVQPADPALIRDLDVDVVIPAYNQEETIALCLASVMRQTIKPSSVTVIDDGSADETAAIAEAFAAANGFAIRVIRRRSSIGKTPGLKIESRNLEGDVEFVLDADTVLVSVDYIEQVIAQLYRVPGIASACGVVYPLRERDRAAFARLDSVRRLVEQQPRLLRVSERPLLARFAKGIGAFYRDTVYQFMQLFFYPGVQNLFGSIMNPVGCAVAYRRQYLRELFDRYEPAMGDNMTSSEDIFFGSAFIANGYHNTQVSTVVARSDEPAIHRMPGQLVRWSSAWLQTAYYLPEVAASPFRAYRRYQHKKRNAGVAQRRRVVDGYRQPFGLQFARQLGRPAGWMMLFTLFEKVSFVFVVLAMLLISAWTTLGFTIAVETMMYTLFLVAVSKDRRLEYAGKSILMTPLRYATLPIDIVTVGRFVFDLATGYRGWRK